MNKIFKGLLATTIAFSPMLADHTNKTFLMPRPTGVDLPMEYNTWEELVNRKSHDDKFGGHLQVVGFYYGSSNDGEIGKYFGIKNKSSFDLTAGEATANESAVTNDVDLLYFLHDQANAGYTVDTKATISLDPEHDAYGARFDYYQNLDCLLKGLFLKANLPVVCVENDAKLSVNNPTLPTAAGNITADQLKTNLINFFRGDAVTPSTTNPTYNAQDKLTNALYKGRQSETGVADIDVALGYKFLNKENYYASLALAITIPTGNDADGVYMFEPIVGNGQHFGLGGNFEGMVKVWGDCDQNIKLHLKVNYRYLFEHSEHRTLGIKNTAGTVRNWGHYYLLAPCNTAGTATVAGNFIPAANKTTLNVDVTPGSQLDGILGFAYNNGGFTFDLGYNLYVREAEDVHLKDTIATPFALAGRNARADGTTLTVDTGTKAPLNNDSLVLAVAETPSQATHSIYGGFGYIFKEWEYPLQLRIGGKYEWPGENSAIEKWTIHGGIGIGF